MRTLKSLQLKSLRRSPLGAPASLLGLSFYTLFGYKPYGFRGYLYHLLNRYKNSIYLSGQLPNCTAS